MAAGGDDLDHAAAGQAGGGRSGDQLPRQGQGRFFERCQMNVLARVFEFWNPQK